MYVCVFAYVREREYYVLRSIERKEKSRRIDGVPDEALKTVVFMMEGVARDKNYR